jgi:hypothetical protein
MRSWPRCGRQAPGPGPSRSWRKFTSPLGLWLTRTAYAQANAGELLEPGRFRDAAAMREHLYNALIPALIRLWPASDDPNERSRPRRKHDPTDVKRWLGYLADLVGSAPDLAWWQLAWATESLTPALRRWVAILTTLVATAVLAVPAAMMFSPSDAIVGDLMFGAATGLGAGMAVGRWAESEPGYVRQRLHRDLLGLVRAVAKVVIQSFWVILSIGLTLYFMGFKPVSVLVGFIVVVLLAHGVTTGFIEWAEAPAPTDQPSTPPDHLRADRKLNLLRMTVFGSVYGLLVVLGLSYFYGVGKGLVFRDP